MSDDAETLDAVTDALQAEAIRIREALGLEAIQITAAYNDTEGSECFAAAGSGSTLMRRGLTDWLIGRWRLQDAEDHE